MWFHNLSGTKACSNSVLLTTFLLIALFYSFPPPRPRPAPHTNILAQPASLAPKPGPHCSPGQLPGERFLFFPPK